MNYIFQPCLASCDECSKIMFYFTFNYSIGRLLSEFREINSYNFHMYIGTGKWFWFETVCKIETDQLWRGGIKVVCTRDICNLHPEIKVMQHIAPQSFLYNFFFKRVFEVMALLFAFCPVVLLCSFTGNIFLLFSEVSICYQFTFIKILMDKIRLWIFSSAAIVSLFEFFFDLLLLQTAGSLVSKLSSLRVSKKKSS